MRFAEIKAKIEQIAKQEYGEQFMPPGTPGYAPRALLDLAAHYFIHKISSPNADFVREQLVHLYKYGCLGDENKPII